MKQDDQGQKPDHGHQHDHDIPIFIDDVQYKVPDQPITGAALRQLPQPPVPDNMDLIREMHGNQDDVRIQPTDVVTLEPGTHFYTAPTVINAGGLAG